MASTVFGGVNTLDADNLQNQFDTYSAIGIYEEFTAAVSLMDSTDNAVGPNDTLDEINLADFDSAKFILLVGQFPGITATLETVVPEPTTLGLIAIGLLASMIGSRRQ